MGNAIVPKNISKHGSKHSDNIANQSRYPSALKALGFVLLVVSVTLVSCQSALTSF